MSDAEQPQHAVEAQVQAEMQQAIEIQQTEETRELADENTQRENKKEKEAQNQQQTADAGDDEDPARRRALTAERLRQASAGLLRADLEDPALRQDTALSSTSQQVITKSTTIILDEVTGGSMDYEIITVNLPRSPTSALVLMESLGIWAQLTPLMKLGIISTIISTSLVQTIAAITLFIDVFSKEGSLFLINSTSSAIFNVIVLSFIFVYLCQDAVGMYKMLLLLRHPSVKKDLKTWTKGLLDLFIVLNLLFYIFLFVYGTAITVQTEEIGGKLQTAVAVFFIIELDDWLYNVTIEPMNILNEEAFKLQIKANPGSRQKRFAYLIAGFWTLFIIMVGSVIVFNLLDVSFN